MNQAPNFIMLEEAKTDNSKALMLVNNPAPEANKPFFTKNRIFNIQCLIAILISIALCAPLTYLIGDFCTLIVSIIAIFFCINKISKYYPVTFSKGKFFNMEQIEIINPTITQYNIGGYFLILFVIGCVIARNDIIAIPYFLAITTIIFHISWVMRDIPISIASSAEYVALIIKKVGDCSRNSESKFTPSKTHMFSPSRPSAFQHHAAFGSRYYDSSATSPRYSFSPGNIYYNRR